MQQVSQAVRLGRALEQLDRARRNIAEVLNCPGDAPPELRGNAIRCADYAHHICFMLARRFRNDDAVLTAAFNGVERR